MLNVLVLEDLAVRQNDRNLTAQVSLNCRRLLENACRTLGFSARGFDRVRRVARTLADLEGSETIEERHMAEAVQYRRERRPNAG